METSRFSSLANMPKEELQETIANMSFDDQNDLVIEILGQPNLSINNARVVILLYSYITSSMGVKLCLLSERIDLHEKVLKEIKLPGDTDDKLLSKISFNVKLTTDLVKSIGDSPIDAHTASELNVLFAETELLLLEKVKNLEEENTRLKAQCNTQAETIQTLKSYLHSIGEN